MGTTLGIPHVLCMAPLTRYLLINTCRHNPTLGPANNRAISGWASRGQIMGIVGTLGLVTKFAEQLSQLLRGPQVI